MAASTTTIPPPKISSWTMPDELKKGSDAPSAAKASPAAHSTPSVQVRLLVPVELTYYNRLYMHLWQNYHTTNAMQLYSASHCPKNSVTCCSLLYGRQ